MAHALVLRLAGGAAAEDHVEHSKEADDRVELILAARAPSESVLDGGDERRGEEDAGRLRPGEERARVGRPARRPALAGSAIGGAAAQVHRKVRVAFGGIGLGHDDAGARKEIAKPPRERPDGDVEVRGAQRGREDVAPAGNGPFADLLGAQCPEDRRGRVAARVRPITVMAVSQLISSNEPSARRRSGWRTRSPRPF